MLWPVSSPIKRGGRPRAPVQSSSVSTYLPVSDVDALCRLARRSGVSVSACIRTLLKRELRAVREGTTEPIDKP